MRMVKWRTITFILLFIVIGLSDFALAKDEVGTMVAIRGKAIIERDKKAIWAKVNDSVFFSDTISTMEASRAKMLFIEDSVLTLGEKSKVVIKEFVYSKDKRGRSIFNLIDGKMRAIVGKTNFEVHTPTAVAAARGSVVLAEVTIVDGKIVTTLICLEGEFEISIPGVPGTVKLKPGMKITIPEGATVMPDIVPASDDEIDRLRMATDISHEVSIPGPAGIIVSPQGLIIEPVGILPPGDLQPRTPDKTPVNINVIFP
jgi:hypothetical protein